MCIHKEILQVSTTVNVQCETQVCMCVNISTGMSVLISIPTYLQFCCVYYRRSHSTTSGMGASGPCTAPLAWREAAWPCPSSAVRSVWGRWKGRDRYSSSTQTSRRYRRCGNWFSTKLLQSAYFDKTFMCACFCLCVRHCPPIHRCLQQELACRHLRWVLMPSACQPPSAKRSVPVLMPPVPAAVTGDYLHTA